MDYSEMSSKRATGPRILAGWARRSAPSADSLALTGSPVSDKDAPPSPRGLPRTRKQGISRLTLCTIPQTRGLTVNRRLPLGRLVSALPVALNKVAVTVFVAETAAVKITPAGKA